MKKIIILITLTLTIGLQGISAREESFAYLLGSDSVNVVLDYSKIRLEKIDKDSFELELVNHEFLWYKMFNDEMNASNKSWNLTFGSFPNARYAVLVQFIYATSNGGLKAVFRIVDLQTISEKCSHVVTSRGGIFGPYYEIFGESVGRIGEEIGDLIKDNMY